MQRVQIHNIRTVPMPSRIVGSVGRAGDLDYMPATAFAEVDTKSRRYSAREGRYQAVGSDPVGEFAVGSSTGRRFGSVANTGVRAWRLGTACALLYAAMPRMRSIEAHLTDSFGLG